MFNWFRTINSPKASDKKKIHSEEQFKNMWLLRADSLGSCGRKAFSYKNVCGFKIIRIRVSPVQTNPDNNKMKMLNT